MNSASLAALRRQVWSKQLYTDARENLYLNRFIGKEGSGSIIEEKTDLLADKGYKITFGLGIKLSGSGVTGDNELEGNEEEMTDYAETIEIDQIRNAIRLTGKMDEKKNAYEMRTSAKNRLSTWMAETIEQDLFYKLCGNASATFANTPTAAASSRSIFAGGQSAVGDVTAAMKMDTKVLDAAKQAAEVSSPRIRPVMVNGEKLYVVILHPYDATNLRQDPVWNQAQRDANVRGDKNPIFSGAMGKYNGMVIHTHPYIYRTDDGNSSAYISRNLLLGQQAGLVAWGKKVNWTEKSFDYGNKWGYAGGAIYGALKPMFNSVDYGVMTMFTAGAAASTA